MRKRNRDDENEQSRIAQLIQAMGFKYFLITIWILALKFLNWRIEVNILLYFVKTWNKDGKIKEAREMAATAGLENNEDTHEAVEKSEVVEKKCKMVGEGTRFYRFKHSFSSTL